MTEVKYKVMAPIGNLLAKDTMTEKELREYVLSLIQESDAVDSWQEKAAKDPLEDLLKWLRVAGYTITQQ